MLRRHVVGSKNSNDVVEAKKLRDRPLSKSAEQREWLSHSVLETTDFEAKHVSGTLLQRSEVRGAMALQFCGVAVVEAEGAAEPVLPTNSCITFPFGCDRDYVFTVGSVPANVTSRTR